MAKLPTNLTYNDLNGVEAVEVLVGRFRELLYTRPPFGQQHLTLPMAKITLDIGVHIDMYPGGSVPAVSAPETFDIAHALTINNEVSIQRPPGESERTPDSLSFALRGEVNAAPIPGGRPPDRIREEFGLAIPRPSVGPREIGAHITIGDIAAETAARHAVQPPVEELPAAPPSAPPYPSSFVASGRRAGIVAEGYVFASEPGPVHQEHQSIPLPNDGKVEVDFKGDAILHAGIEVSAGTHVASKKVLGDRGGAKYGSVNGVYDAGPAGLMRGGEHGLYGDGRPRISFGNNRRG